MTLWLAFDIGTTGAKVALVDSQGRTVRSTYRDYETYASDNGVMEQNAEDWWAAVSAAVHELNAHEAGAITLTGQMQDVILVDGQGAPVRPVILYSDSRARSEAEEINALIGADELHEITGNVQDAGSLLAKLLWLSRHELDALTHATHLLLGAADYIAHKLTGVAVTDTTTATTTGLLDIRTRSTLSPDLFAAMGLSDVLPLLPKVNPGGALAGPLRTDAAQALRLKPNIPVYHGPGDAGATTLGAGSGEPGHIYAYIGTSGWVAFTSTAQITQNTGIFTLAHPALASYIYIAPLLTAGGNLDWLRELFGVQDHALLIEAAQHPSPILYLPYLNGERSPFTDPLARGAFIGLNARHNRADLSRAVLQGVIYAYRHALDVLIAEPVTGLMLTGGGTRSAAWCQLFADILGIPIQIANDAENVGVRGAVLAAAVQAKQQANYAPPDFFPATATLLPNPKYKAHYDRQYAIFKSAYPTLRSMFGELSAISAD